MVSMLFLDLGEDDIELAITDIDPSNLGMILIEVCFQITIGRADSFNVARPTSYTGEKSIIDSMVKRPMSSKVDKDVVTICDHCVVTEVGIDSVQNIRTCRTVRSRKICI